MLALSRNILDRPSHPVVVNDFHLLTHEFSLVTEIATPGAVLRLEIVSRSNQSAQSNRPTEGFVVQAYSRDQIETATVWLPWRLQ